MGFAVDPNSTFRFVLVDDRQKPASEQRTFIFRYLTARECGQVEACFEKSQSATEREALLAHIVDGLKLSLVGWENLNDPDGNAMPFEVSNVDAVASRADLYELRDNSMDDMTISEIEKKRHAYASLSTTANSAK